MTIFENRTFQKPAKWIKVLSISVLSTAKLYDSRTFDSQTSSIYELYSKTGHFENWPCRLPYCQYSYCRLPSFFDCRSFRYRALESLCNFCKFLFTVKNGKEEIGCQWGEAPFPLIKKTLPVFPGKLSEIQNRHCSWVKSLNTKLTVHVQCHTEFVSIHSTQIAMVAALECEHLKGINIAMQY